MTNKQKVREIMCCICQHWNNRNKLCYEEGCIYYIKALEIAEWKDNQLAQSIKTILDTETEMLKDIAENKMAKPATRKEYINILTERVKEVMNGN